MTKVLIVDDEPKIREVIREYALFDGFEVVEAGNGIEAIEKLREGPADIAVIDIMMPKLDGFSLCKEIRKNSDMPILLLSARGEEYDKLFGFELGVDDYMVKPFSPKELLARIKVILKRHAGKKPELTGKETYAGLEIDYTGHTVFVDGKKAALTPKEYDLLTYLVKNKNIAKSREKLLADVWGFDFYGDDRTVDTHIKMLRANLGPYRDYIVTIRSIGYKFEDIGRQKE